MARPNVRGKGKKDERISELEDVIRQQQAEMADLRARLEGRADGKEDGAESENVFTAPTGKVRRRQVRARAYTLYRGMGGDAIDQALRNAHQKGRCYNAQLRAAEYSNPDLIYGENITAYEDRMNTSAIARLSKEKRAMFDLCLKEAAHDAADCEELGADFESEQNSDPFVQEAYRQSESEHIRLNFSPEEEQELIDWLEGGQQGPEPDVGNEIQRALMYCRVYPERLSRELVILTNRIDNAVRSAKAREEAAAQTPL